MPVKPSLLFKFPFNPAFGNLTIHGARKGFDRLLDMGIGVTVKGAVTQQPLKMAVKFLRSVIKHGFRIDL